MKYTLYFIACIVLCSCNNSPKIEITTGSSSNDSKTDLWVQNIENSNKRIYKFDRYLSTKTSKTPDFTGLKLKSKAFESFDELEKNSFRYFRSIPSSDTLEVIEINDVNLGVDRQSYFRRNRSKRILSVKTLIDTYEHNIKLEPSLTCTVDTFRFQNVEETRDSLIFKSVTSQTQTYDRISIPKGNVYLNTGPQNMLVEVILHDWLRIEETGELEGKFRAVRLCKKRDYFQPIDELTIYNFTDYGIFKPVK